MPMNQTDYQETAIAGAPYFLAVSHPARIQILLHLAKYKGCRAGSISARLPLAKSTVSQHLTKLRKMGLVTCTREENVVNYTLNDQALDALKVYFEEFMNALDSRRENRQECCPGNEEMDYGLETAE
jgi:DNA-binding transcriptional ArsR family regulator